MSADAGEQPRPAGPVVTAVRDLDPGYFAFVMATGIVSTGVSEFGPSWLSLALLAIACTGLVMLGAAVIARLVWFRSRLIANLRAPERAFTFFSIPASLDVVGSRFVLAGHPLVTAILGAVAAATWFLLTYGVPASLLLARAPDSVLGGINGTWLLWIVATQSLSVAAATLGPRGPRSLACSRRSPLVCGASGCCSTSPWSR